MFGRNAIQFLLTLGACEARDEGYGSLSVYLCVCLLDRNLKNARFSNKIEGTNRHESKLSSEKRVEFCKTLYLLRYGTSEHPRAFSFEATPFKHAQSVSVRYLIFHVVGFETVHQS